MFFCAFGPPSALSYWGFDVVRTILQHAIGDYHLIVCNRLEELRGAWGARDGKQVLLISDCLESAVSDLITNTAAPFVIFADDPVNLLTHLKQERGLDALGSLRLASQCISSMADLYAAPSAHIVSSDQYERNLADFVTDLMGALGVEFYPERLAAIVRQLGVDDTRSETATVFEQLRIRWPYLRRQGEPTDDIVGLDLAPDFAVQYGALLRGARPDFVEWPKSLFLTMTGAPPETAISLVGPARHLTYGPYMHLPRGRWIARIEIEVAENRSGNSIFVDVVHQEVVAMVSGVLPSHSVYEFDIHFPVVEPLAAVEIRISIMAGAIEGKFALRRVRLISDKTHVADATSLSDASRTGRPKLPARA